MRPDTPSNFQRLAWTASGGVIAAGLLAAAPIAIHATHAQAPPATPPAPSYMPSVGDLMTTAVQPRHIKLGLAGHARNWEYATYEVSELRGAFNRVVKLSPIYNRTTDMAQMVAANIKDPIDQMTAAIKAKDGRAFDIAYTAATRSCNTCHEGLEHSFVVIKEPVASAYPDQSFAPVRTRSK
jgi:hypothetical protein